MGFAFALRYWACARAKPENPSIGGARSLMTGPGFPPSSPPTSSPPLPFPRHPPTPQPQPQPQAQPHSAPPPPVEDARLRPIRLRPIRLRPAGRNRIGQSRNWLKSKLAEVKHMVFALFLPFSDDSSCFLLFFLFSCFLLFLFLLLVLSLLHLRFPFLSRNTFARNPKHLCPEP